jgi:hypothetical protein
MHAQQKPQSSPQQQNYSLPSNIVSTYNANNLADLDELQKATNMRLFKEQEEIEKRKLLQQQQAQMQQNMQIHSQSGTIPGKSTSTQYHVQPSKQIYSPPQNLPQNQHMQQPQQPQNPKQKSLNQIRKEYEDQRLRQVYKRRVCGGDIDIVDKVDAMLQQQNPKQPVKQARPITQQEKNKQLMERFYSKTKNLY